MSGPAFHLEKGTKGGSLFGGGSRRMSFSFGIVEFEMMDICTKMIPVQLEMETKSGKKSLFQPERCERIGTVCWVPWGISLFSVMDRQVR